MANKQASLDWSKPLYKRLDEAAKEIRVLRIEGIIGNYVSCSLQSVSLNSQPCPIYDSLSWCWGDTSRQTDVIVNGHALGVSQNAAVLLRWLLENDATQPLWLDAICINQTDISERNSQVAMMRDIYSAARTVIVALDTSSKVNSGQAAISSIQAIVSQCEETTGHLEDLEAHILLRTGSKVTIRYVEDPLPASCDWHALGVFFSAAWFTRIWVIQEVVLAQKAICHYGEHVISWNEVSLAARWMQHRSYWRYMTRGPGTIGIDNTALMWDRSRETTELSKLLGTSRCFKSTDPRDKIFGMLGLQPVSSVVQLRPDYTKSVKECFVEATRSAILETQKLDILAHANSLDPPDGTACLENDWPSWTPRYDWEFDRLRNSYRPIRSAMNHGAGNGEVMRLHADGLAPFTLQVNGVLLDTVAEVSGRLDNSLLYSSYALATAMHRILKLSLQAAIKTETSFDDTLKALADTLTANPSLAPHAANQVEELQSQFESFLQVYVLGLGGAHVSISSGRSIQEHNDAARSYKDSIWLHSINRRFYVSESGMIGLGPRDVQSGDIIAILFGAQNPFILRSSSWGQICVGDTYVHGKMAGEHIKQLQETARFEESVTTFRLI